MKTKNELKADQMIAIVNMIDSEYLDLNESATNSDKISGLFDCFCAEYDNEYNRKYYGSDQAMLTGWLQGLPSCIHTPIYNGQIAEYFEQIGLINDQTPAKKIDQYIDNFWSVLSAYLFMMKKNSSAHLPKKVSEFLNKKIEG